MFKMPSKPIRTAAKAIIIENGCVLLIRCVDQLGDWYLLPGGGQEHGEPLYDTLVRECREEASIVVAPGEMVMARDYIAARHEFAQEEGHVHQLDIFFICTRVSGEPGVGDVKDEAQTGVEWVSGERLADIRIYPDAVKPQLLRMLRGLEPERRYLGSVN